MPRTDWSYDSLIRAWRGRGQVITVEYWRLQRRSGENPFTTLDRIVDTREAHRRPAPRWVDETAPIPADLFATWSTIPPSWDVPAVTSVRQSARDWWRDALRDGPVYWPHGTSPMARPMQPSLFELSPPIK